MLVLNYHREALTDLVEDDGLLIMAKGLGLYKVAGMLLSMYSHPQKLVILVGAHVDVLDLLQNELSAHGCQLPIRRINTEKNADERMEVYAQGGVIAVTSRILAVDLLGNRLAAEKVNGMVVFDAHRVLDTTNEAFILRIYRQANKSGFIKGFSDNAEGFMQGFALVEKVMRCLYVKKLYLWPRFHVSVNETLSKNAAEVIELHEPMTASMTALQKAAIDVMEACLKELKRTNRVECVDVDLESALFKSFDYAVRKQLDRDWHRIPPKTKALVSELTTIRKILNYIGRFDSVTYYEMLETIRSVGLAEAMKSFWLLTPAAHHLFTLAKDRVFQVNLGKAKLADAKLKCSLEKSPKWALLEAVLDEIHTEANSNTNGGGSQKEKGPVVVFVRDERTASQLRDILTFGQDAYLEYAFRRFCCKKYEARRRQGGNNATNNNNNGGRTSSNGAASSSNADSNSNDNNNNNSNTTNTTNTTNTNNAVKVPTSISTSSVPSLLRVEQNLLAEYATMIYNKKPKAAATVGVVETNTKQNEEGDNSEKQNKEDVVEISDSDDGGVDQRKDHDNSNSNNNAASSSTAKDGANKNTVVVVDDNDKDDDDDNDDDFNTSKRKKKKSQKSSAPKKQKAASASKLKTPVNKRKSQPKTRSSPGDEPEAADINHRTTLFIPTVDLDAQIELRAMHEDKDVIGNVNAASTSTSSTAAAASSSVAEDIVDAENLICIHGFEHAERLLEQLRPRNVVLYDPDLSITRALETYRAGHPNESLRVYFMVYEDSVEEKKYIHSVNKEREAFERLIHAKATMTVPANQDGKSGDLDTTPVVHTQLQMVATPASVSSSSSSSSVVAAAASSSSTRNASKNSAAVRKSLVVVDNREFRCSLPPLLHSRSMQIAPATLEVGDYVLAPEICVERKSIPDLYGAFASGRLFQQCSQMVRNYKIAILLIEFDEGKSFSLNSVDSIGSEIAVGSIISKLVLLTTHLPALRIFWSRSPRATAQFFEDIKQMYNEPSPEAAAAICADQSASTTDTNLTACEMLKRLPGITVHNWHRIADNVRDMCELATLTKEHIAALIGPESANQLYEFLHAKAPIQL